MPVLDFKMFNDMTGPLYLSESNNLLNDAVSQSYLLRLITDGQDLKKLVQGGESINEFVVLDDNGSAEFYTPGGGAAQITNKQVSQNITVPWRFFRFHYSWNNIETILQAGSSMTREARFQKYKNILLAKQQLAWTSGFNTLENHLTLNAPVVADMETNSGSKPYNLFAFITENGTYLPGGTPAWSTIQGINPATEANWRNQVETYNHLTPTSGSASLMTAFRRIYHKLKFDPPTRSKDQYFTTEDLRRSCILTSLQGMELYERAISEGNDTWRGSSNPSDPAYNTPVYGGIPVKWITNLDTAAVYTGSAEASGEPRYYWVNTNHMKMVFHQDRMFAMEPAKNDVQLPFDWTVWYDTYCNLIMVSRKRQGIVAPSNPTN